MQAVAKLPILLKELRLPIIAKLWEEKAAEAANENWGYNQYLAILSELEVQEKHKKRIMKYLRSSHLNPGKLLSNFDFSTNKSINKQQIMALANSTTWVTQGSNVVLIGPSGIGKTHLSMAIGNRLVEQGVRVLFKSALTLVQELLLAKKNLDLPKFLEKLNRYQVVILDDMGYVKKTEIETSVLFELIADRYENKSLIITCNQPFGEWDNIFSDTAMTIAAIDRIVHHSTVVNITGESFRKREAIKKGHS